MAITQQDLKIFQQCRARWYLASGAERSDPTEDDYYLQALKKTIFQMYVKLQEKNRLMTDRQVRQRWDKNWWVAALDRGSLSNKEILERTTQGWLVLEKYWDKWYIEEINIIPIGINLDLTYYNNDVKYKIHTDLILAAKDGSYQLRQFGGKTNEWELFVGIDTKLETTGLGYTMRATPKLKTHIDILSSTEPIAKQLNIDDNYCKKATQLIDSTSSDIAHQILYASPSNACGSCPFKGKCWI